MKAKVVNDLMQDPLVYIEFDDISDRILFDCGYMFGLTLREIQKISSDIEEMKFNTSVATFMTMTNEFYKDKEINRSEYKTFLQLMNPFAPHITEELFSR